jgi:hypothetical protein
VLEGSRTDEVVVGLVPADGVDAAERLHIGITDRADDDIGNNLGAHVIEAKPGCARGEIEDRLGSRVHDDQAATS